MEAGGSRKLEVGALTVSSDLLPTGDSNYRGVQALSRCDRSVTVDIGRCELQV